MNESTTGEVRRLAIAGVGALAVREVAIRLVQLGGIIVLARLLIPHDFGAVAVGVSVVAFATFLADAGLGAALIRRPGAPTREQLEALLGLQLMVAVGLATAIAAAGTGFGEVGRLTAVMACSLPLLALRAPIVILLERELDYRPLVLVEVVEVIVYYGWAVGTALVGWGVWSLATGAIVRSAVGSGLLLILASRRLVRPRFSYAHVRGLIGFGARYQAVGLTNLLRDQGLNLGTAAIGGVVTLGVWNVAYRILQVPYFLFGSLWRVSYPAMSRLIVAGETPRPVIERGVALASVATGALLAPLVGSAPALVPTLLGEKWQAVVGILPWPCLGLMIGGPISVATAGFLYAVDDAGSPLRATVLHTIAWLTITLPLLPVVGVRALGFGWLASSVVDAVVLGRAASQRSGARLLPLLIVPTLLAAAAAGLGWELAGSESPTLGLAVLGGGTAEAVYFAGLLVLRRRLFLDVCGLTGQALRASMARA